MYPYSTLTYVVYLYAHVVYTHKCITQIHELPDVHILLTYMLYRYMYAYSIHIYALLTHISKRMCMHSTHIHAMYIYPTHAFEHTYTSTSASLQADSLEDYKVDIRQSLLSLLYLLYLGMPALAFKKIPATYLLFKMSALTFKNIC